MIKNLRVFTSSFRIRTHKVSYYFTLPPEIKVTRKIQDELKAEVKVSFDIHLRDGYTQGPVSYDNGTIQLTGWWSNLPRKHSPLPC